MYFCGEHYGSQISINEKQEENTNDYGSAGDSRLFTIILHLRAPGAGQNRFRHTILSPDFPIPTHLAQRFAATLSFVVGAGDDGSTAVAWPSSSPSHGHL
jgi:hypothetical protein